MMKSVLGLLLCAGAVLAIPVDNGVEGEPEIECGPTGIQINFNTRNEFEGQVYVKGLFAEAACVNRERGRQVAGITLPFDSCNTRRQRSLNPRGVFVTTTVIISFHPLFITKVDRAYRIQCFYMEADKTVSTELEVSMLTTDFRTQNVPMPVCRYELLNPADQTIVQFAIVGQPVLHKWTCDTETVDTFCMVVHSCFVDDTNGDRVDLVGPNGCALDRYLLNNPEYPTDLMGQIEAHVFKYADRPQLYFECQIAIYVKEPGQTCPRPACPVPAGRGAGGANPPQGPNPPPAAHPFPIGPGPYSDLAEHFGQPQIGSGGAGGAAVAPRVAPPPAPARVNPATPAPARPTTRPSPKGRGKRAAPLDEPNYIGVMDVSADLDTLDAAQTNSALPNLPHRLPAPVLVQQSGDYCMSGTTMLITGILGCILLVAFLSAIGFLISRRK